MKLHKMGRGVIVAFLVLAGAMSADAKSYLWLYKDRGGTSYDQNILDMHLWGNDDPNKYAGLPFDADGDYYFRWVFDNPLTTTGDVQAKVIYFGQNQYAPFNGALALGAERSLLATNKLTIGYGGGYAKVRLTSGTFGTARTGTANPCGYLADGAGGSQTDELIVDGADSVFQTAYGAPFIVGNGHSGYVTVRNGALWSGPFYIGQYGGMASLDTTFLVTGSGSRLVVPAESTVECRIGTSNSGNSLVVSNGASCTILANVDCCLGRAYNSLVGDNNRLSVLDNATFESVAAVRVGYNAHSNLFEVAGGATAYVKTVVTGMGPVSGHGHPIDNVVRVSGNGSRLRTGTMSLGYLSSLSNRLVVADGATCIITNSLTVGANSSPGCSVEITNGGRVESAVGNRFAIGDASSQCCSLVLDNAVFSAPSATIALGNAAAASNCVIGVRNGSTMTTGTIFANDRGSDCSLTVDNSTLQATDLRFGTTGGVRPVFNTAGSNVCVRTGAFYFENTPGVWNVSIPADSPSQPIVSCYAMSFFAGTQINVSVDEGNRGGWVTLVESTVDISDANMSAISATLPEGVTIRRSADKKRLVLKIPSRRGILLIVY